MAHQPVTVERFFKEPLTPMELKLVAGEAGLDRVIREPTINRPGLALAGCTRYFANKRVQVIGNAEAHFLRTLTPAERQRRYHTLLRYKIPCFVFSRNLRPDRQFVEMARQLNVPVFISPLITMKFINLATMNLESFFAPRNTEMGSMVDIQGVGVIIKGESGIGKSESVLALIERGYSLVSDDITKVTLVEGHEVVGSSPDITRYHMEVRGIGIVNVISMFGIGSIRHEKRVDLVVSLKAWGEVPDIDRLGMDGEFVEILGVKIPHVILPVRPGRDLARLIEVAAFQTKLKDSGYNAAKEFNDRLLAQMASQPVGHETR